MIYLVRQQNTFRRYGHVLRKDKNDWVKACMHYETEGGLQQRIYLQADQKNLQTEAVENTAIPDKKIRRIIWIIVNGGNELKILGNIHKDKE